MNDDAENVDVQSNGGADTRCDQGMEVITNLVAVVEEDEVALRIFLCKAAFSVAIHLDGNLILDHNAATNQVQARLGQLSPGLHSLSWSYITNVDSWKVQSELTVNDATRFRQRKGNDSNFPFNHSFLLIEVQ